MLRRSIKISPKIRRQRAALGASLVEVALTIFIFMGMVLGFLWLSLTMNARTSLTISMAQALRFGVTRGAGSPFGDPVPFNAAIEKYRIAGDPTAANAIDAAANYGDRFKKLLYRRGASDAEGDTAFNTSDKLSSFVALQDGGDSFLFYQMPVTYIRTLMAIHEYMRLRVGNKNLKYPCDDRPDCLGCKFLNPGYTSVLDPVNPEDTCSEPVAPYWDSATGACDVPITRDWAVAAALIPPLRIVLQCTYVPDFGLFRPFMTLLGGTNPKAVKITRTFSIVYSSDF